ncbi:SIR2 family protein [Quadrisphaera sp. KR29]|uniref:SIR2 family protein n=1 Tax=Quadrisphaera sp. KR29 TaxID=3461391 RepID=UPI004043B727
MTAAQNSWTGPGHVFVVHGDLGALAFDAVAIPTDWRFSVGAHWRGAIGGAPVRPEGWAEGGARIGSAQDRVWFVDVGSFLPEHDTAWLVDGVRQVLEAMAEEGLRPARRDGGVLRSRPLLAIPLVGIGRGGFTEQRGEVVLALLRTARQVARARGVDVAVVTNDPAVYAAMQHVRRSDGGDWWQLDESLLALAQDLAGKAREGSLALFLGAGVSVPAGLPTWTQLVTGLSEGRDYPREEFQRLGPLDQAELLRKQVPDFERLVIEACRTDRHAIGHSLLASLGCAEVVTTNFDDCYERAHDAVRKDALTTVLPHSTHVGRAPWLLKMHGDVEDERSIVLSRRDFVRYDAGSRPAAAVLQSLLLTRHLLVVGASLTDDNVLRLVHEVASFHEERGVERAFGTVLDVEGGSLRGQLWDGQLAWHSMPGDEVPDRARAVELFLDALAARASSDESWLLDDRFAVLLASDEQRELAAELRGLRSRLAAAGAPWGSLVADLDRRGAPKD